jgi:hypothetical protein
MQQRNGRSTLPVIGGTITDWPRASVIYRGDPVRRSAGVELHRFRAVLNPPGHGRI